MLRAYSTAELEIVVCSDKFVGTALVPTKLVGIAVPIENQCVKGGGLLYCGCKNKSNCLNLTVSI